MNCANQCPEQSYVTRKLLKNTSVMFLWPWDEGVEFQSLLKNLTFGRFSEIALKFIPLQSDRVFNFKSVNLVVFNIEIIIITSFYDFFVTWKNLGFRAFFCPYRKRDESYIGSDDLKLPTKKRMTHQQFLVEQTV